MSAATHAGAGPATAVGETLVKVEGLRKSFGGKTVLTDVDFSVGAGELVAFLGANGSGKSTTLRCVAGLMTADAGAIDMSEQRPAMVFQKMQLVPRRSALDNVCSGGFARVSLWRSLTPGLFPASLKAEAMHALERVGMADFAHNVTGRLSGGQQQRVAIARALCQESRVILADEPVSALDPSAADNVMELLADLAHQDGFAIAAVLHQPDLAARFADRAIGLRDGRIVFSLPAGALTPQNLSHLYDSTGATP